jgi:hypothetical protein
MTDSQEVVPVDADNTTEITKVENKDDQMITQDTAIT